MSINGTTGKPFKTSSIPVVRSATRNSSQADSTLVREALEQEREGGVVEDGGHVGEEGRALRAVGQSMVEGDRQRGHPARLDPLLGSLSNDPGSARNLADTENAGLPWIQNGRTRVDGKDADIGDRERAARHVSRLSLAITCRRHDLLDCGRELDETKRLSAFDVGYEEPARRCGGNSEVHRAFEHDLLSLFIPERVEFR